MARIATRNGKPAHMGAAPRLRASDLDPRELPEWLQAEAERDTAAIRPLVLCILVGVGIIITYAAFAHLLPEGA